MRDPITQEFTITVVKKDPLMLIEKGPPTFLVHPDFKVDGPPPTQNPNLYLSQGSYQKNNKGPHPTPEDQRGPATTIRLNNCPHAVIRIRIAPDNLVPVGIAFHRADGTQPSAVPCAPAPTHGTPFSGLKIRGDTLEFTNQPTHGLPGHAPGPKQPSHITYRFVVFIQDRNTGGYGVIDPELENEN